MKSLLTIAIDGPSGVGKGTLAKALAIDLNLPYLDTGLLYRAIARKMLDSNISLQDEQLVNLAENLTSSDWNRDDLRTVLVDKMSSQIAVNPFIRQALLKRQRTFASEKGGVLDGRDIGTVVLPEADFKFYITASPAIRAKRRWLQYADPSSISEQKKYQEINDIQKALLERDLQDETRSIAPLKPAEDAIIISTDFLSKEEVFKVALSYITQK